MNSFLKILLIILLHTPLVGMETTTITQQNSCTTTTMTPFEQALSQQEDTFPPFWKTLSSQQQKELTNNAGVTQYNNPALTALIADTYFPQEIIAKTIMPCMKLGKVINYINKQMLQKNLLCDEEQVSQLSVRQKLITHENGSYHSIPVTFEKHAKSTGTSSCLRFMSIRNHEGPYIVISNRTVGDYDYIVTAKRDTNNLCIWRIKNATQQQKETWIYSPETNFTKKTYEMNGRNAKAFFSPNGKYVALVHPNSDNHYSLFTLDETSPDIVTNELILPKALPNLITKPQFNSSSTIVAFLSFDKVTRTSQLILHHLPKNYTITRTLTNMATSSRFNTAGNILYIAIMSFYSNPYILVYNLDNLDDITTSTIENIPSIISSIEYDTNNNCLAAQLYDGTITFISENHTITHVAGPNNEHIYDINQNCLAFLPKHSLLISYALDVPYITLWDTTTETMIGRKQISYYSKKIEPCCIVIAKDENSFLTNNRISGWNKQILYTPEQKATIKWIKKCPTLFKAHILRILYKAHKNKSITLDDDKHIQHFIESLPTIPHNIQHCIKEFLTVQKETTFVKVVEEKLENLLEQFKSFFF